MTTIIRVAGSTIDCRPLTLASNFVLHALGLLRARGERPCDRAAEQRDERAASDLRVHSITSSARASRVGGMVRPSVFAVLVLITRSNTVGSWIGRSDGLAPLRTCPATTPARR